MRSETLHTWIIAPYHKNRQAYWESAEDHDSKVTAIAIIGGHILELENSSDKWYPMFINAIPIT